jgi:hypothetical protein
MKIFLVSYGGGHVTMLAPVEQLLRQSGHTVLYLALTTAQQHCTNKNISFIGFKDLLRPEDQRAKAYGMQLLRDLPSGSAVAEEESIAYLGLSYADLVDEHGEAEAERLYAERGRQVFSPVATLKAALKHYRPDVVVATNSPRAERAAILAAGQLGIPSVCLVDLFGLHEVEWIAQPGFSNRICVLDESIRQMFIDRGRSPEEVVVTGNPSFDHLVTDEMIRVGAQLRSAKGWDDGCITLLLASQIEPERHLFTGAKGDPTLPVRVEKELRHLISNEPQLRLVVRYHPNQHWEFIPAERVEFSSSKESIGPLLHAVDIVITFTSTVAVEAHVAGKKVFTVDCSVYTPDAPYSKMGISTGVNSVEELPRRLKEFIPSKKWQHAELVENSGYLTSATQKVVSVIESLHPDRPQGINQ